MIEMWFVRENADDMLVLARDGFRQIRVRIGNYQALLNPTAWDVWFKTVHQSLRVWRG